VRRMVDKLAHECNGIFKARSPLRRSLGMPKTADES
jgi:hypothetical protein